MKTTICNLVKVTLIFCILGCPYTFLQHKLESTHFLFELSNWLFNPEVSFDTSDLSYLVSINAGIHSKLIEENEIQISEPLIPSFESRERKRIYLYNTHQTELYKDGVSVYEVSIEFAKMLKNAGFEVVFESENFIEIMEENNKEYHELYDISRLYLNEAFVNYGGFDLVIDLHRDAIPKSASTITNNGVDYAKLMFVVGMRSNNVDEIMNLSLSYTDKINQKISGIMREPFERQSVYNQDMFNKMILLEAGGNENLSKEVLASLKIFAEVLKEEML